MFRKRFFIGLISVLSVCNSLTVLAVNDHQMLNGKAWIAFDQHHCGCCPWCDSDPNPGNGLPPKHH